MGWSEESKVYSSSDTVFNREALIASLQWAFKPGMKDAHPVDAFYLAGVTFEMRKVSSNGYAIQDFPQSEVDISKPFPPRHETLTFPSSWTSLLPLGLPWIRSFRIGEQPKCAKTQRTQSTIHFLNAT